MFPTSLFLEFRARKPIMRKFFAAIAHVDATEDTELEHLFRGEIGLESRIKLLPHWGDELIAVAFLHPVAYDNRSHTAYVQRFK